MLAAHFKIKIYEDFTRMSSRGVAHPFVEILQRKMIHACLPAHLEGHVGICAMPTC